MKNYFLLLKSPAKIMPIIHWILSIALGITIIENSIPIELIALSGVSFILAWFFAVGINDYYDIEIDKIANPLRPLITEKLTKQDVKYFFIGSGAISLILAIICDLINAKIGITILTGIYLMLGICYSMPPIRLKSRTQFSSVVIGIVTSECILIGGVFDHITGLIILYSVLFFFISLFLSSAKDFKDIDGDKSIGVPTIPVKYGTKTAALIFQLIYVLMYSSLFLLYYFQPLSWIFSVYIVFVILIDILIFQRFKKLPSKENGELIYKIGFSLYIMVTIFLIILNL